MKNLLLIIIGVVYFRVVQACSYAIKEAPMSQMFNRSYWENWSLNVDTGPWQSKNRILYHNDAEFIVKGVNFNGIETTDCRAPLGLSERPLSFFFDFLQAQKFNALRIPLSFEVMANTQLKIGYCVQAEPSLSPGQPVSIIIKRILDEANKRGIYVIFDLHTIGGKITPMPWTDVINENMVVESWLLFLKEFHAHPALMGIEIKNEPHDSITLEMFLTHCAKVITNIETYIPEYKGLYFISGIQNGGPWGGAFDHETMSDGFKDLAHPSILCTTKTSPQRFVFNPHVYGTSVRGDDVDYEGVKEWENRYGFITSLSTHWNSTAIIPTEVGGFLTGKDKDYYYRWLDWHLTQKGLRGGGFWWTLAPFSDDTGGIFNKDYSVNWDKVEFMRILVGGKKNLRGRHA